VVGASPTLDWSTLKELRFEQVDHERFPAIELAWRAVKAGGTAGAILNAANEVAVAAFLDRAIPFPRITQIVAEVIDAVPKSPATSLEEIMRSDAVARETASRMLGTPARVYG
jgi:1-deoxy-D-xylulose-5-phosphate reductoisomerase